MSSYPISSACLYCHDGWTAPFAQAQSPHDRADFRFVRRPTTGNGYVASRAADSYDDVTSGESGAVIARRNARERDRVKTINQTFARLRQHVPLSAAVNYTATSTPHGGRTRKLSKVQILRAATHYIHQLRQLLVNQVDDVGSASVVNDDARTLAIHHCISTTSSSSSSSGESLMRAGVKDQIRRHEQTDDNSLSQITRNIIPLSLIITLHC